MTTKIALAKQFAHDAHDSIKQVRKYTGEPYWIHTDGVAELVESVRSDMIKPMSVYEDVVCAAHLHDVLEDVTPKNSFYSYAKILELFGGNVVNMVQDLTDQFTKENYPKLNRKARKILERERLGKVDAHVKTIKLADLINNTESIVREDPDFARVYLVEKLELLPYLTDGHPALLNTASWQAINGLVALGMPVTAIH